MGFTTDSLEHGWCSELDCSYQLDALDRFLGGNAEKLQRAIRAATGDAQALLRAKFPDAWPFATPPPELREWVAAIAVYKAVRSIGAAGGQEMLMMDLRKGAEAAERFLRAVAMGQAEFTLLRPQNQVFINQPSVAQGGGGEFGFG